MSIEDWNKEIKVFWGQSLHFGGVIVNTKKNLSQKQVTERMRLQKG